MGRTLITQAKTLLIISVIWITQKKTGGIFTASQDSLTGEQKKALKSAFRKAQSNKSIMWQSILSFDNRWLDKYGIYDPSTHSLNEEKIRQVTRMCVCKNAKKEKFGKCHLVCFNPL